MSNLKLVSEGGTLLKNEMEALDTPLRIRSVTVSYDSVPAVYSADIDVKKASLTAIVGPNGAGKSSLLKAAMGIVPTISGEIRFFGQLLNQARQKVSYVPQRTSIDWDFPITVEEVVLMGLYPSLGLIKRPKIFHLKKVKKSLEKVGMLNLANRQIGQLSGGQQQRVFLARALVQEAELLLLDEPLAGVDAATEKTIIKVLESLRTQGKSSVIVHHDINTVKDYFDHVVLINRKIIAQGTVSRTFTVENLTTTYGGLLSQAQLAGAGC